ncbi:domain of kin17 curved DNA-binding protein domain-containing protein [Ditylenchus destructor]|uniref:Domain of kin17 curved DNA-binding protein domain-containing protein n=1 Tax=Ditylenchus destructor TaxID=166010 RepID=A0AAD4RDV5_9BILA|nr:domain of kin17 curved DNA-binding protein domain-containing protein [Ditylenchus destructor]
MGKHEKGTPKDIAKRIKSKGLQKLRWFCQMCQKQCRDQNGFKCHLTSESHQRQLLLFAENQNSYLRQFSKEFEGNFMHILRHTFGTKRVRANDVYQDYIKDKGHVHMNSTVWHTLTGFVLYLGSSGKCKIDENEKGWHIQYIDQEEELRKHKVQQRAKQEKDDEERMNEILQRQIENAKQSGGAEESKDDVKKEFQRENEDDVIKFAFQSSSKMQEKGTTALLETKPKLPLMEMKPKPLPSTSKVFGNSSAKRSALEQLIDEEESFKEKRNRKDYWLHKGIIVKLMTKKLGSEFYKAKGEVVKMIDKYTAEVSFPTVDGKGEELVRVDQENLETVIPAIGRDMLIVNGAYRGERATLLEIMEDKFMLKLRIKQGTRNGRILEVAYEDASKCT